MAFFPTMLSKALHNSVFSSVSKSQPSAPDDGDARSIQFFTTCPEAWGGSEELWAGAARRLVQQGYRVNAHLSFLDPNHPEVVSLLESGVRIERYRGIPFLSRYRGFGNRWEPTFTIARLRALRPLMAVISQGENMDGFRQIHYCKQAQIPYVLICQKAMDDVWPMDEHRSNIRASFNDALRVFFVSEHNRTITEEQIGQKLPNAEVVHNPFKVDYNVKLPWPESPTGGLRLACVARLWTRDKGQDILLRTLALKKWRERDLQVDFFGNGPNEAALRDFAQMLGITDKAHFCGFSRDVTEIWRQHHALILPSRHEGLPLALVEALLCARPAITTDAGGNTEVMQDEETGFIARALTVGAIDDALERAWNRRHEWQKIGVNAARHVRRQVPEDPCGIFTEKIAAIYHEVEKAS
jgi:glycosyltransferase involved in cell wall biosynthesis